MSFTTQSVDKLRQILVESKKYSIEDARKIKGKANLVEAVMSLDSETSDFSKVFDSAEPELVNENVEDVVTSLVPSYGSYEWHNYVMSNFREDELINGYPTINGLRRVSELLLGPIEQCGPTSLNSSLQDNRAFCTYKITFLRWLNCPNIDTRTFSASGGCSSDNTEAGFSIYPECMAETRAEARTLRRALSIRIAAADELKNAKEAKQTKSNGEWTGEGQITESQRLFLEKKCGQLRINVNKFAQAIGKTLANLSKEEAKSLIAKVNEYQQNFDLIPNSLKEE